MKTKVFLASFLILFLVGIASVHASGLAGTCGDGATPCALSDLGKTIKGGLQFVLLLTGLVMIVSIVRVGLSFANADDKAQAWKDAKDRLKRLVIGMILVTLAVSVGGYVAILKLGGVGGNVLDIITKLFGLLTPDMLLISHAYAAETLPNPVPGATDLYAFLLLLLKLFIRWFVFPVLIFSWVFTGFKYVSAQGNPDKLTEAHKYLWYTLIGTVIIMLAEGFATAISGTISQFFK